MYLGQLIEALEAADQDHVCPMGFARPHSYRGFYEDLAFEPEPNMRVADMLACAKSALGETFQGWKGGDYKMHEYTTCWLAERGESNGDGIGPVLLGYLLGTHNTEAKPTREAGSA